MEQALMDIKQVAEYLQMNKMTVYKLAREGKIPAFKVASEWRFSKQLIDSWLMGQLKGQHAVQNPEKDTARACGSGQTVLVVDDEEVIRDFFIRSLKGYRVLTARSGEEALVVIQKDHPDLVLLDIKMPGIDGIETLRRIKKADPGIVVIMLSAYETMQTNLEAARLGAYSSMSKPFDLSEMGPLMQQAMSSAKTGAARRRV